MRGLENLIAVFEPTCRALVKRASATAKKAIVDRFLNERMIKQKRLSYRTDHPTGQKPLRVVVPSFEKISQRRKIKALTQHRRGLYGQPVWDIEAIEAGLDKALDRTGDSGISTLDRIAEKLFQEERVPRSSFDAPVRSCRIGGQKRRRKGCRFICVQQPKLDDAQRRCHRTPSLVELIVLEPRGHYEE